MPMWLTQLCLAHLGDNCISVGWGPAKCHRVETLPYLDPCPVTAFACQSCQICRCTGSLTGDQIHNSKTLTAKVTEILQSFLLGTLRPQSTVCIALPYNIITTQTVFSACRLWCVSPAIQVPGDLHGRQVWQCTPWLHWLSAGIPASACCSFVRLVCGAQQTRLFSFRKHNAGKRERPRALQC